VHELGITQNVVDAVTERTGSAPVASVRLRVGRLAGVVPDAMRFCFELVTAGTPLEGAALEIEQPEGRGRCRACGAAFALPDLILLCGCGSADVEVLAGRELSVVSVALADRQRTPSTGCG
jgi:hydrogenase nickel incorporation protein HypA/HybF